MGEYKNTILAILLSLIVVVGWQYFIGYPQMQRQQEQAQLKKQEQTQAQPGQAQPGATQPSPSQASAPPVPNAPTTEPPAATREAVIAFVAARHHRHAAAVRQHRSQGRPHR